MHTLAERHQDRPGGRAVVSPGPSDRLFHYRLYQLRLNIWILLLQIGINPVRYHESI